MFVVLNQQDGRHSHLYLICYVPDYLHACTPSLNTQLWTNSGAAAVLLCVLLLQSDGGCLLTGNKLTGSRDALVAMSR